MCSNISIFEYHYLVKTVQDFDKFKEGGRKAHVLLLVEHVTNNGDHSSQKPAKQMLYFWQKIVPDNTEPVLLSELDTVQGVA